MSRAPDAAPAAPTAAAVLPAWSAALDLALALCLGAVAHRLALADVIGRELAAGAALHGTRWGAVWHLGWSDPAAAAVLAGAVAGCGVVLGLATRSWFPAARRAGGVGQAATWLLAAAVALAVGVIRKAHLDLVAALKVGLGAGELLDAVQSGEAMVASRDADPRQWLQALLPLAVLGVLALLGRLWGRRAAHRWLRARLQALALVAAALALPSWLLSGEVETLPREAAWSAETWTLTSLAAMAWRGPPEPAWSPQPPRPERQDEGAVAAPAAATEAAATVASRPTTDLCQPPAAAGGGEATAGGQPPGRDAVRLARCGARWTDPRVTSDGGWVAPTLPAAVTATGQDWNLVWILMESTGTRYVEGQALPGRRPMPTLDRLAAEGWKFAAHRSPSNSSATSIAAQWTGLYPLPAPQMFSISKDNHLPALPAFLPRHDRFLYTPGKLSYFFPRPLLEHAGLRDMHGFAELADLAIRAADGLSRDELGVVDRFCQRLQRAREPFFATYYSFVPHWEYTDYGPRWRHWRGGRMIDRYHNNLALLDEQIARIVEVLRARGVLERTILVLVGDHGEAFGQHERNWAHSRGSYEENLQTPVVLWQPRLFAPRVVRTPTSHIDLLPTVLDAMRLRYDPWLLQGESLWAPRRTRTVSLHWGNESAVTALRHSDQVKMIYGVRDGSCRVFALASDPGERHPRACRGEPVLLSVIKDFLHSQRALLPALSAAAARGEPFEGRRHPGMAGPQR